MRASAREGDTSTLVKEGDMRMSIEEGRSPWPGEGFAEGGQHVDEH